MPPAASDDESPFRARHDDAEHAIPRRFSIHNRDSGEFQRIIRKLPPSPTPESADDFLIEFKKPRWGMGLFCFFWGAMAFIKIVMSDSFPLWDPVGAYRSGLSIDMIGRLIIGLASPVAFIVGLVGLFGRKWFVFERDRLAVASGFSWLFGKRVHPRNDVRTAGCSLDERNARVWHVKLLLTNEERESLIEHGDAREAAWLAARVRDWLATATGTAYDFAFPPRNDLPEDVRLYSPEEIANLEHTLTSAGQPSFHSNAVVVASGAALGSVFVLAGFLLLWLAGWYGAAFSGLAKILGGERLEQPILVLFVPVMLIVGLMPVRIIWSVLSDRLILVVEPGRIRVRKYRLFLPVDFVFDKAEGVFLVQKERLMSILHTLELASKTGKRATLAEWAREQGRHRWLIRFLREKAGVRLEPDSPFPGGDPFEPHVDFGFGDLPPEGDKR